MGISTIVTKIKQNYNFLGIKQAIEVVLAECDLYYRSKLG